MALGTILFTGSFSLSSCEKLVEINRPVNTVGTESVFNSDEKALSALSGMYALMVNDGEMKATNGAQTVLGALLSDETNFGMNADMDDIYEFYNAQILKDNGMVMSLWAKPYQVIYAANAIESGINNSASPALTAPVRKQILGEAKLVRAFLYFNLVNTFGDIPLVLTTDVNVTKSMTKSPVAAVNSQIERDLNEAFLLLNNDYSHAGGKKLRPNKYAAAALLARQYLYMGRWDEAAAFADTVIRSGRYSLTTVANTFKAENSEALWQMQSFRQGIVESYEASYFCPPFRYSEDPITMGGIYYDAMMFEMFNEFGYLFPLILASDEISNSFDPADRRMTTWMDSIPTPFDPPYNGKVYRFFLKYDRQSYLFSTPGNINNTFLRLAEMYLVRAEALARGNRSLNDAVEDINVIRRRAGLADLSVGTKEEVLNAIETERRHEFFAEWSHRWFDMKRWGKAASVFGALPYKQPWSSHTPLLPIPEGEILNNPKLLQNPGY